MGEGKRCRRARASAVATAVAITAPILFLGGALARAANAPGGTPTSSSVTYTDAHGDPSGPAATTTTTTGEVGTTSSSAGTDVGFPVNGANENTGSTGGSADQTLEVSILHGNLTVTPSTESVSFANAHGQGNTGHLSGSLSTVTVVDARGSLVGWNATVSLQSVDGLRSADLAKAKLCVSPDGVTVVAGNPPEVKSGQRTCAKAGDPLTLFYAPPNGGGGTFSDTGSLTLQEPGATLASPVTATLAVAVH